jgi:alkanesulfonate monooxygenase SsuD/methylene tetrahydromethanopterin reductase-like flavin-dependent oxidoreductase (luciferase family)
MKVWHFSEMAYHPGWEAAGNSMRNTIPSRIFDPKVGADLYNRYLDEWAMCDDLGLNIMVNEHHATATCTTSVVTVPLAILARQTQKVRLLSLGMPIANRTEPIRVAEEYSMIDVISRGRLEMGFVKGAPYEVTPANSNPTTLMERFWEAHDLILKAMTTHDGPFNWEGQHFHYRQVNCWPRPYQAPHPPIWITAGSPDSAVQVAEKGYVIATLNTGFRTRGLFDTYRERARSLGWEAKPDRFAYLALVGVGNTKEEGFRRADQILDYIRTNPFVAPQFTNPPGYSPEASVAAGLRQGVKGPISAVHMAMTRDGRKLDKRNATVEECIDAGLVFAGTPDMVYEQICEFNDHAGGLGHLLMMAQGGWIDHKETEANLKLFSKEVLPRVEALN